MKLKDMMTPHVEVLSPDDTLKECAQKMKQLNVGAIPVGENDRLVGMVTDRDIVVKAVAEGHDPSLKRVRDAMTSPITYCFEDDDVESALQKMEEKRIRRLLVLNRDKRLVGIVALGDVAAKGPAKRSGEALGKISQPLREKAA